VTQAPTYKLVGVEAGATVEYQVDQVLTTTVIGPTGYTGNLVMPQQQMIIPGSGWSVDQPLMHEGLNSFTVRQTDSAGNVSDTRHVQITVDTHAPSAPLISLVTDSGTAGDGITNVGQVAIDGLEANTTSGWEYSLDGGLNWTFQELNNGSGHAMLDLTSLGDGPKNVLVHQIDAAGNVGESASLGFTLESITGFTVTRTETGLEIVSGNAGVLNMSGNPVSTTDAGHNVIVGTTTVGAQPAAVSGTLSLMTSQGVSILDESNQDYFLGTDGSNELGGHNVWGFGGSDWIEGTPGADQLYGGADNDMIFAGSGADLIVGGTGGDTISLGADRAIDTIVIHSGDTLRNPFSGSIVGMDVIKGMEAGDVIKLDDVFTADPSYQSTLLTTAAINQVAIVRGMDSGNTFTPTDNGTSYLIQWSDGHTVNTIELSGYGPMAPELDINVANDTIMLIGVSQPI
jgi:hypothetical protein